MMTKIIPTVHPYFPYKFLLLLILLAILCGVTLISSGEYFKIILSKYILQVSHSQAYNIMLLTQLYSFQVIILFLFGFPIAVKALRDIYTVHLVFLMRMWLLLGLTIVVEGVLVAIVLLKSSMEFTEFLELELFKGMDSYYSNPEWRFIWDSVQYRQQCCGVYNFQDWTQFWSHKIREIPTGTKM